jgi:hypothetical protein
LLFQLFLLYFFDFLGQIIVFDQISPIQDVGPREKKRFFPQHFFVLKKRNLAISVIVNLIENFLQVFFVDLLIRALKRAPVAHEFFHYEVHVFKRDNPI